MIDLTAVNKSFERRGVSDAVLVDVSVHIPQGAFCSVVGPSGCGKTTLLKILAGFEFPSSGTVAVGEVPVTGPSRDRGVVFQAPHLYPWLSVEENVGLGFKLLGSYRQHAAEVASMLHGLGLATFGKHKVYELSGGMQQRVAIGRALMMQPRVLLMDEPFGALDAQTRNEMQAFLLGLWQSIRATVVFVTHDVEEAILLSDRVIVFSPRPGRVRREIDVPLPRPRVWDDVFAPEFQEARRVVLELLRSE